MKQSQVPIVTKISKCIYVNSPNGWCDTGTVSTNEGSLAALVIFRVQRKIQLNFATPPLQYTSAAKHTFFIKRVPSCLLNIVC